MKKWAALFALMCFSISLIAQIDSTELIDEDDSELEWLKGNMNETHVYGIRFGLSTSTLLGGELDNPRPLFGLNGAVYYRYRYSQKSAIQAETGIAMRGSKFANSTGQYSSIRMYYVDVPLMWVRSLNKNHTSHFLAGAQYSHIIDPKIYLAPSSLPDAQTPKLKNSDISIVAGTQFYAGFVGFQLIAKYGLMDINNGLIQNLSPAFKNKDIHNFTFEINFLF